MNTNELKRFAREARIKLLDQVGRKLEYVITADTAELRGMSNQINDLRTQINKFGKGQVIEKVAYTWFNRLMALRFMDANGYNTPMVVTPIAGYLMPQVLQEAKAGNVEENLQLDRKRLNDLLDGKTQVADSQTEAYKLLLIASCNSLNSVMPFMFERISDYTELLLPDDLLSDYSIITDVRNGMTEEDCKQEELIGWLYQFYIVDKKDEVFSDLKKNVKIKAENIPAATQLFTPRWIVCYMVENTLGKLWLTLKPSSKLKEHMPYYIEAPDGNEPTPLPEGVKGVTDIKFLDPCQGSGHVLVYAFDLFTKIYEEEGYNTNEIPALILENNLFGIDIDERAAQLAAFALTMKGRSYYARFLRKPVKPNVIALENIDIETIEQTIKLPLVVDERMIYEHSELTLNLLTNADNFGSLIEIDTNELKILKIDKGSIWEAQQEKLFSQATILANKYQCVVTNPPYMGWKGMNEVLKRYVETNYYESRTDLMGCFIERCISFSSRNGYSALINQQTWMFISSYENLRKKLLSDVCIDTLLHLGLGVFKELNTKVVQSVAFTILNSDSKNHKSAFYDLRKGKDLEEKESLFTHYKNPKTIFQENLLKIPGFTFAYWLNEEGFKIFENKKISDYSTLFQGMITGDNSRFVRAWYEVSFNLISIGDEEFSDGKHKEKYWCPYNKGGESLKWYGNQDYVVNFKNDGVDYTRGKLQFKDFFFKEYVTWSYISLSLVARYFPKGFLWDVAGSGLFPNKKEDIFYITPLLTSKVGNFILEVLNPTLNFQVENIAAVPLIYPNEQDYDLICSKTKILIVKVKEIHDSNETTWSFNKPLFLNKNVSLEIAVNNYLSNASQNYYDIHKMEEELNRLFIQIYSLSDSIKPFIEFQELTVYGQELHRESLMKLNSKIERDPITEEVINYELLDLPFSKNVLIERLLSYSVGCFFGRYGINKPGLIIASQNEEIHSCYNEKDDQVFSVDEDNIIPVLDGEYFTDDIVGKLKDFLNSVYGYENQNSSLLYIENIIGKEIRQYFVKDFYNDHIKRYKKRPIYWMFSSPKGHFKALIYMHRYRSDTISTMLNDYLRVYIGKLESEKQSLNQTSISESASAREQTLATKRIAEIEVMLKDLKIYERTLFDYAAKKIEIDLDDGVKVNYLKFKEILVPIKGLDKDEE